MEEKYEIILKLLKVLESKKRIQSQRYKDTSKLCNIEESLLLEYKNKFGDFYTDFIEIYGVEYNNLPNNFIEYVREHKLSKILKN